MSRHRKGALTFLNIYYITWIIVFTGHFGAMIHEIRGKNICCTVQTGWHDWVC